MDSTVREPRQSFIFAHEVLPTAALRETEEFAARMLSPQGADYLQELWNRAGRRVPPEARAAPLGLDFTVAWGEDDIAIICVTFPRPEECPEAWFAAILFRPEGRRFWFFRRPRETRYLTLEAAIGHEEGRDGTVLAEWRPGPGRLQHLSYGPGPAARQPETRGLFLDAALKRVRGR